MRFFYLLLLLCSMTVATGLQAQQSFQTRIAEDLDDVDEALAGSSNPEGAMDTGSSDLELGNESADGSRPQIIGLRFQNVSIPKGSVITNARIVFTVDNTDKNADPCTVDINMQAIDDAPQFTETDFDVTSRTTLDIPVNWTVPEGTWITIGEAGPDQTTPDLSALVQQIVDRAGWAAGNSMVFTIQGSGLREAESYSSPDQAPLLMIDYIPAQAVTARIASGDADAEENLGDNSMDVSSSDIELGAERTNGDDPQVTGLHFSGLNIPKGALITNATIQFYNDNEEKNGNPASFDIQVQLDGNPALFSGTAGDISSRPTSVESVNWPVANDWNVGGTENYLGGADQLTPDLSSIVQVAIDQEDWETGNPIVFIINGTGTRTAASYENEPTAAAFLSVSYILTEKIPIALLMATTM